MPSRDFPTAIAEAGMVGLRRGLDTQVRLAKRLWSIVSEADGDPRATALVERSDVARNWMVDMALDWSVAARTLASGLQRTGEPLASRQEVDGRTVVLPARIRDASQGSATWAVEAGTANKVLEEHDLPFDAVRTPGGTALLSLFMVDYRDSDLGAYRELGAAIIGRPARDPHAPPGLVVFALPVSLAFSRDCGRQIWGYPKVLAAEMTVTRERDRGLCMLAPGKADTLAFGVSRRGFGRSVDLPLVTYTTRAGTPCRTIFHRTGAHERMQAGGRVDLRLGGAEEAGCACGLVEAGAAKCLCRTLRRFGLPERQPVASGWTELMSGSFGRPEPLEPLKSAAPVSTPVPAGRPSPGEEEPSV